MNYKAAFEHMINCIGKYYGKAEDSSELYNDDIISGTYKIIAEIFEIEVSQAEFIGRVSDGND